MGEISRQHSVQSFSPWCSNCGCFLAKSSVRITWRNKAGSYLNAVSPTEKPFEVDCFTTMMLFLIVDPTFHPAKGDFYHIPTGWVSHHFISPTHQPWGRSYHCIFIHERMERGGECTAQNQRDKWKTQGRHILSDSKAHSPPFILGQGNLMTSSSLSRLVWKCTEHVLWHLLSRPGPQHQQECFTATPFVHLEICDNGVFYYFYLKCSFYTCFLASAFSKI